MPGTGTDNKRRQKVTQRGIDSVQTVRTVKRRNEPSAAQQRREAWEAQRGLQSDIPSMQEPWPKGKPPEIQRPAPVIPDEPEIPTLVGEIERLNGMSVAVQATSAPDSAKSDESTDYLAKVRNKAREYSVEAVDMIATLMRDRTVSAMVRWRAALSIVEIAERDPGRGKKRLGELGIDELRELANSLRNQERLIGSGATVEGVAKSLPDEGRQPDQPSGSLPAASVATIDQVPATPAPARARRSIE